MSKNLKFVCLLGGCIAGAAIGYFLAAPKVENIFFGGLFGTFAMKWLIDTSET